MRIYSSREQPSDAYAAVRYRDYWFWIDDRDMKSKSEFLFVLVLFSLAETGVAPQTPVITVPASAKDFPEDVWSSLRAPSAVPVMTMMEPSNAVLAALLPKAASCWVWCDAYRL